MKAVTYKSKKQKGKRLELKIAQLIREKDLDIDSRRMPGSGAFDGFKGDLHNKLPYTWEVKNQETVKLWAWWQQAKDQATIAKPPILCVGGNFKPILAVLEISTFLDLLRTIQDLEGIIEDLKQ